MMGFPIITILLLSIICPPVITDQTISYDVTSTSSVLISESASSASSMGLSTEEALSTKDEMTSKASEMVLVGNQKVDEASTASQTAHQGSSDMTSNIIDEGHNNIVGSSEHNMSTDSSTMADKMSTTKSETTPVNGLISTTATSHHDQNVTATDGKSTTKHEMTHIPPKDKDVVTGTPGPHTTENNSTKSQGKKGLSQIVLIGVIIVILILLLIIMIVLIVRKKRRSGSQSFLHSQSRKSNRQDVWAGEVPEMGDGKMLQDPVLMENGAAGSHQEPDKELTTFVNGGKKVDSAVEMEEMAPIDSPTMNGVEKPAKEDDMDEKRPLLEENSEGVEEVEEAAKENQFLAPSMEQDLV